MSIYEGAVKRPIMTSLCFLAVIILGVFSLIKLPIDLYPDIDTNTIMVMTYYTGASAEDIENNVTRPLENTLNSVEHLKHITSSSKENISVVTLQFEYGYDIDVLTNNVRDKLDMVSSALPTEAQKPIIFKFSTDMIPILLLSVQAEESQSALYKILDDNVANPIARIDGVGTVSISGAPQREINVYMDPQKMEAYNLSPAQVASAISAENRNVTNGTVDVGSQTFVVRVEGEFDDPSQMLGIVVGSHNGVNVYLRDVARIVDSLEERAQKTFTNGVQGAVIVVQKQSGANSVEISNKVMSALPTLQKNLPSDVKLGIIVNTSDNILNTIGSLEETIMYAMIFVALVVFVFLGRWRATMIIVITIPMSLIASFIYLYATGGSLNMISLSCLSIAIGNVVDDAIVVLENVTTHIERGSDPKQAAIHATNEVAISVIASTLTMIAVFFPLTMVTGMAGVLFKQLGWMMCIIMTISTTSALSFTPMLCSQMLKLKKKQSTLFKKIYGPIGHSLDKLDEWYEKRINWSVRHRWTVIAGCVVLFAASIALAAIIGIKSEFFPTNDSGRVGVTLELPVGTRVEKAEALAKTLVEKWQKRYGKDLQSCNFTVGQAGDDNTFASLQNNGSHIISFNIMMVPSNKRDKGLAAICDEMRADCKAIPELAKFQVLLGGQQGAAMGGQSTATFEVYGYDLDETRRVAEDMAKMFRENEMVTQTNISRSDFQPEIVVDFDRDKLAKEGLTLTAAAGYVRNLIYGSLQSYYREDGEEYDIKVRFEPTARQSIESIENMIIPTATGKQVRIKDVATVRESAIPPTIERKDRQRIVTVSAVLADGYALSDGVELGESFYDKLDIPAGITVQVAGSYEDQQDSNRDLGTLGILIIILVFIVMAAQFESLTYPFIIILSVPFAASGIILSLVFTGTNLNIMSMLGAIMLIGIVVKNGIVLIDYTQLLRERGIGLIRSAVMAARSRLRPILMTTLTTILGMVPMAVSHGVGAEMWRPLGVSVIGGLTVATILTLIYVPSMFCIFGAVGVKRKRKKLAAQRELDLYWKEHKAEEQLSTTRISVMEKNAQRELNSHRD
ncbi:MAG: efflux RND transporter permease subunit [Prevotellaceae bacterium]|nr:efflux RND transporter permease subunit [Candidatus Minthosoma equi]